MRSHARIGSLCCTCSRRAELQTHIAMLERVQQQNVSRLNSALPFALARPFGVVLLKAVGP
jgi:hypothetical protein